MAVSSQHLKHYVHPTLLPLINELSALKSYTGSKTEVIFISTWKPYESVDYNTLIGQIRRRELPDHILLLGFRGPKEILPSLTLPEYVTYIRLPVSPEMLEEQINELKPTDASTCGELFLKAQCAFVTDTFKQMKHGKSLELINTVAVPIQSVCSGMIDGSITDDSLLRKAGQAALGYLNRPEMHEFLNCLKKVSAEDPRFQTLNTFFEKCHEIVNQSITEAPSNPSSLYNRINELFDNFDSIT